MKTVVEKPTKESIRHKFRSAQIIPISFLGAIAVGTLLLLLPFATATGEQTDPLTALFTATTATCVTGLVVVDTFSYWSLFGKIIILILIQLGGLGVIAVTSILMLMVSKKMSLSQTVLLHDAFNLNSPSGLRKFLIGVFAGTFAVEGVGALLYMPVFIPQFGVGKGIWVSFFTSISAFCNAGIDIIGNDSLVQYNSNPLVMFNTMMLIILGGLGYVVWFDILSGIRRGIRKKYSPWTVIKKLSEHTKLVLSLTLFLIVSGAIAVLIMEYTNPDTLAPMSFGDKLMNAYFQSVTFRTAGFAAVPQQNLREVTASFGNFYMFIGGSPGGTAGGVKTVTVFVVIANAVAFIRSRNETVVFGRRLDEGLIKKASAIICVSFSLTFVILLLLMMTNDVNSVDAAYEIFSATATVGLSRGLTPTLNVVGRMLVIVCMFLGRIGPISMALFFNYRGIERNKVKYTKGNFFAG